MIYRIPRFGRQLLAVGLALLVAGLVVSAGILPLMAPATDVQDSIDQERSVLGRLQAIVGDKDAARANNERANAVQKSGLFIEGESEAIRLASVQSQIAQVLAANAVKPRLTRGLPIRDRDNLTLVGTQVQIVAPIEKVQKILLDFEQHQPVLLVDYLQIAPSSLAGVANDQTAGFLDARFDVYAVALNTKGE